MSDTDSDSSQQFNMQAQVPEQQQTHVRQILQKARKILPSYDQASLYNLYKRYYSVDSIFFNELNIISKRMKGQYDQGNNHNSKKDWISVGKKVKTTINKDKYNFLDDRNLVRRAEEYLRTKKVVTRNYPNPNPHKNYNNNRSYENNNQNGNNSNTNDQQPRRGNRQNNQQFQERKQKPAVKYQEKVVQKQENKQVKSSTQNVTTKQTAPVNDATQQQKQAPNKSVVADKPAKVQKYAAKQEQASEKTTATTNNVAANQANEVKHTQAPKKTQTKKQQAPKKTMKYAEKKVENKQEPKPTTTTTNNNNVVESKPQPAKKRQSQTIINVGENFNLEAATKTHKLVCSQNSFVLKFILPQSIVQKVSYIRTPEGGYKDVKVKVAGTRVEK